MACTNSACPLPAAMETCPAAPQVQLMGMRQAACMSSSIAHYQSVSHPLSVSLSSLSAFLVILPSLLASLTCILCAACCSQKQICIVVILPIHGIILDPCTAEAAMGTADAEGNGVNPPSIKCHLSFALSRSVCGSCPCWKKCAGGRLCCMQLCSPHRITFFPFFHTDVLRVLLMLIHLHCGVC